MADSGSIDWVDTVFNRQKGEEKIEEIKKAQEAKAEAEKKKKLKEEKKKKAEEVKKNLEENYPIKRSSRSSNMFGVSSLGGDSLGGEKPAWRPTNIAQSLDHISNFFNKGKDSPNGMFDSEQSNNSGHENFDEEPKKEPSSDEKSSSGTKSSTPNVGNSTPTSGRTSPRRNTSRGEYADLENSGKSKEWYENLANSSYANDKEYKADMEAFRKMQAKATVDNDGKSKEWYENLANSSYANDKKYEADMKAFKKMQADEIAKNGYYTDSQGVKVYAKAMTDKPKKENNNE